jgi:hypothetical protein
MAARRIVSLVALALVAIINLTLIVDAQIIPEFPRGSLDVGGVPTLPGTHSGSGGDWSLSGSVGDIWVRLILCVWVIRNILTAQLVSGGRGASRTMRAYIPPTETDSRSILPLSLFQLDELSLFSQ